MYVFLILFCGVIFFVVVFNGTKHMLSTPVAQYNNFTIMCSISLLALLVVLVMYSGHPYHMSVLALNMAD